MNRIEFEKTMEILGFDTVVANVVGELGEQENAYLINDCIAYYSGNGHTCISGRIPLEFANMLWEKYGDSKDIIIDGVANNCSNPEFGAVDKIYERKMRELNKQDLGVKKRALLFQKAKEELEKRSSDTKYILKYNVNSTDALVTFLTEMVDYYASKEGFFSIVAKKHDKYVGEIFTEILSVVKPKMSIDVWIKNTDRAYLHDKAMYRMEKTEFGREFLKVLKSFDNAVNPYQDSNVDLANIETYINNVNILGVPYFDGINKRANCMGLKITDKITGNLTCFEREANGFSYYLLYTTGDASYKVTHYFNPTMYEKTNSGVDRMVDEGEVIHISKVALDNKDSFDIKYNITHDTVLSDNENNRYVSASDEDRLLVYNELLNAVEMASSVTYDNMKKGVQKNLN